jgi:hypothetical protein
MIWEFTHDEAIHVWAETRIDTFPPGLDLYDSTTDAAEHERMVGEIRGRLPHGRDRALSAALCVIAHPTVRISVMGGATYADRTVRIVGCAQDGAAQRQVPGYAEPPALPRTDANAAALIVQKASVVRLWSGSPAELPDALAAAMPPAPAGQVPETIATLSDVRGEGPFRLEDPWKPHADTIIRRMLKAKRTAEGTLYAERPADKSDPQAWGWLDLDQDGRYLIHNNTIDVCATPAGQAAISALVQQVIFGANAAAKASGFRSGSAY